MVNRKERRLAAKTGSNRRVKLDLHLPPQPSGDFGDPSNKEEVGGGDNANTHTGSPDSPSSSGQKSENPLMLLGQYSDEEAEEDSSKVINHDNRESTPAASVEQAKIDNHESTNTDKDEHISAEKVDQVKVYSSPMNVLQKLKEDGDTEDNKTESPRRDMNAEDQASVPLTSDTQTPGDVDSGWKMVLHEESNSYYYWNTVTGETSWEVPVALSHGSESAYDPKSGIQVEEPHVTVDNGIIYEATETGGSRPELDMYNEKHTDVMANGKNEGNHANSVDGGNMPSSNDVNYGSSNVEAHYMDTSIQEMTGYVYQGTNGDSSSDSFRLLQLGESLRERLKSLIGLEASNDQLAKLALELDIRLADIKSLVPYGSSLLPFWLHSENQLKRLEAAINNEVLKCSQFAGAGQMNQAENRSLEIVCGTANEKNPPTSMNVDYSDHHDLSKETDKVLSNVTVALKDSTTTLEAHENAVETEAIPIVAPHSMEDVDMDVEMEVDDESSVLNGAQLDQSIPPIPHGQLMSHGSEDIPPPPNDEWIPPPPPDDESMPPPPPDEPSEPSVPTPPSEVQAVQPYSYGQQYSFSYPPGSGFEYYGQTNNLATGVASNGYYVDANGCQVVAPVQTLYYASVPNPYADATGEAVMYYTPQEASIQTAPVIGTKETSGLQKPVQENIAFHQTESSAEVPSSSLSAHALGSSAVATTVAPTESAPKAQPKVIRNKKRTVAAATSLRSNKKVSGLVDKWKAVKEEMHEDEDDEPEDALEALEKKRQREIEQWRAQQIATGEAKDNANFQPLGGDWRERVRRKRAKKSIETKESVAKASDDTNQRPDLVALTKQLPSGWQAYWDEASKEVYYGNTKTSETTWTKPAN